MKRIQLAFTLIEMMIVVVIIGILAAVAVPAITGEKQTSPIKDAAKPTKGLVVTDR